VTGKGQVDWTVRGVISSGSFSSDALDFAAAFGPVKGMSGTVRFTDLLGLVTAPDQKVRIASINPGIEVTDGEVGFEIRPGSLLRVHGAKWPFLGGTLELRPVDPAALVQGLRPQWTVGLLEPAVCDIDVAALHQAYLRQFRARGGTVQLGVFLESARGGSAGWRLQTGGGAIDCGVLVNAAGAWADDVAQRSGVAPIGITPLLRTVVQLRVPDMPSADLPLIMDLSSRFYFKPEGPGRLWLTPHDEEPSAACDAAPEELAVAEAIARFQEVVDWPIEAVERKWAGLRSFAPDRAPVFGFDPAAPSFFWFAGQGGFGIQTAPAAALLGASLLTGSARHDAVAAIEPAIYSPARFS